VPFFTSYCFFIVNAHTKTLIHKAIQGFLNNFLTFKKTLFMALLISSSIVVATSSLMENF
jgi:hypothetical protein